MNLKEELLREHSKHQAVKLGVLLAADKSLLDAALSIMQKNEPDLSYRASYALLHAFEIVLKTDAQGVLDQINEIIFHLRSYVHQGTQRNAIKILTLCPLKLVEDNLGLLADICIDWLLSSQRSIAVKVHAMQVLYMICQIEPGLVPEARETIRQCLERNPSKGVQSRSKRILDKLSLL